MLLLYGLKILIGDAMKQENKNNFMLQAGILASAGIIVKIIGILYRSPLVVIIGDEGNGYYNTAYNIYTIILLVASYSIPSATSKVISARLGLKEYKNAHKLFLGSLVYVLVVGGIASLFCFFFAGSLVGQNSAQVLKVFSPTIFLSGILGCLRGYFQAHKSMVETSVSQIIEQILNAIVSITAAYFLMAGVASQSTTTQAIYGAIGSALGTGSGVIIALLFMFAIYMKKRSQIMLRINNDSHETVMSNSEVAKSILGIVTPVVLSTCLYNLNTALNLKIYQGITQRIYQMSEELSTTSYGLFSGKAVQIINIPVAIAAAMSSAIIPVISRTFERKEIDNTKEKIASAIKITMLIAIPCAVGLFVLSKPVTMLLYNQKASLDTVSLLIKVLAISVVFFCLSTLSNGILQAMGYAVKPVFNAAITLVIQTVILVLLLLYTDLGLYALCIANLTYSLLMCILNSISIRQVIDYKQEINKTFIKPAISAVIMGVFAWGIYTLGCIGLGEVRWFSNAILLFVDIFISAIIYFLGMIKLGAVTASDLKTMPKGNALLKICRRLRLMK